MTRDELLASLRLAAERKKFESARFFQPYPKQAAFIALGTTKTERVIFAGNQTGKSEVGAFEAAAHLTGDYPAWWAGRRWDRPVRGWAAGPSGIAVRDVAQKKLCGPPGSDEDFGSGMIPRDRITGKTAARGAAEALDTIRVRHSSGGISSLSFKTYEQDRRHWQGDTVDFIWYDEEPPRELYTEGMARYAATGGMSYLTFTPLEGMSEVVCLFLEANEPHRGFIKMGLNDVGHFTPERRAALLASYPINEREARANGEPMLGEGRIFRVAEEDLMETLASAPLEWTKIWGVDFGIDHPFAAALLAWDRDLDVVHILHALKMTGAIPLQHADAMKRVAANVPVAWPHDGHARDKGSGEQLSKIYAREGLNMLETHATHPAGGYSTYAGVTEMDTFMQARRFKVNAALQDFFAEYRQYHMKNGLIVKFHDDILSATRIGFMMRRRARAVPLGGKKKARNRDTVARDVDIDVFS